MIKPGAGVRAKLMAESYVPKAPLGTSKVNQVVHWNDLILPANSKARLREFLEYINTRDTVRAWGGKPTSGPVALFSGASGTGKTFAASVIATELNWPLFRVDLGRLVSKYIGETEKNLNALFDAAHDTNMVLQFDEADALFSKRGDVKDARDRYANLEVSHLLSRIEEHNGPCILTTNLRDQMDPAFARRFHIVADFPRPDEAGRLALWTRNLPPKAPIDPDVNLRAVARNARLTGGSIRNAAAHAVVMAAAAQSNITMRHITTAIWRELGKEGRPISISEMGTLAKHLDEGDI